jgi:polysaccharide export outer membrane protein
MRPGRLFSAILIAAAAAGCMRTTAPAPVVMTDPAPVVAADAAPVAYAVPIGVEPRYRLDSGDKLRVVVFGQEGLTNSYAVDANGSITMPLIGSVPARGQTTAELSRAIAAKLRQGYIREPHVAVEIEAYRPFFILGEVTAPGQYAYVANMTVETAVAIAGGFTPRAYKGDVTITRNTDGALTRGKVPLAYQLKPGDTINVAERWF